MARVTVEDCLGKVENRFSLVMAASKRTKQLVRGAKPKLTNNSLTSAITFSPDILPSLVEYPGLHAYPEHRSRR